MNRQNGLPSKFNPSRLALRVAYQIRQITSGVTLGVRTMLLKDNRIMLVRHTYLPGWHMPGGGVDVGENIHDAAIRETREETGVDIADSPQLFGIYHNGKRDHVALFISREWQQTRPPKLPSLEIRNCELFALDELPEDLSAATRRRLDEFHGGLMPARDW